MGPSFKLNCANVTFDSTDNPELGLGSNIVNLANFSLTDSEKTLLALGLKFIPTPDPVDKAGIWEGYHDFTRKIKLSHFFQNNKDNKDNFDRLFKEKSSWQPDNKLIPDEILDELDQLKIKLGRIDPITEKSNISQDQLQALEYLKRQHGLIFKKADKGNAIVIMERQYYIQEAMRQLNDCEYYKKIDEPIYPSTAGSINEILEKLVKDGRLNLNQANYLRPHPDAKPRTFYLLPKIHKDMSKWTVPNKMPPGRPIVSDCGSDTYRLAEFVDYHLKPLACHHNSYIKDTNDFIEKLKDLKVSENSILVTFDVESLYTNIEPEKGLMALDKMYKKSKLSCMPFKEIRSLLEICLTNNDFKFGEDWYLQQKGTAMGRKFAPHYANIFMANFEEEVLAKSRFQPVFYVRFLDDGFLIWDLPEEDLDEFMNLLKNHDESVKITEVRSRRGVDFMDSTVFKGPRFERVGILDTKVHFKPTDTHQLLDRLSFHPKHTFDGIVNGEMTRYMRLCNSIEDFHEACSLLFKALTTERHYSARKLRYIKARFLNNYNRVGSTDGPHGASMKCDRRRCQCCLMIHNTSYHEAGDSEYGICGKIDCQTSDIIYVIKCKKCKQCYVGETERTLAERLTNHLSDINTYKNTAVAEHFNEICWPEKENLTIYAIEKIPDRGLKHKTKALRLQREAFWISELDTVSPYGMNRKQPVTHNITISLPFSSTSRQACKLIRETHRSIQDKFPKKFHGQLTCAFKRNKNLSDHLVRAKLE